MTKEILELAKSISPETINRCIKEKPNILKLAQSISTKTIERCQKKVPIIEEEIDDDCSFLFEDVSGTINELYRDISASTDNGKCTTRAGTYRKWKTGSGRKGNR
jgi:hypothetical protein